MKRTTRWLVAVGMLCAIGAAGMARAQEPEDVFEGDEVEHWAWFDEAGGPWEAPQGAGPGGATMGPGGGRGDHGPMMGRGGRGMGRMRHGGMGMHPGMFSRLDLTPQQREKMAAAHERQQRKAIQSQADIRLASLDLRKLMRAEKPDPRAIDTQIDRIASLRAGLQKSRVATMLEARAMLTPEQREKLKEMRERGPRMEIRREIRRGGGDM